MAPGASLPVKGRVGPQEEWTAILRHPAKTKVSALQPNAFPGSGPTAPAAGINKRGMKAAQVQSGPRIAGGRPAQDFPRGVLSKTEMESRIGQLREMGFSEQAALEALGATFWNLNAALDLLFTHGSIIAAPTSTNVACVDASCAVAGANADADTLSTLSVESQSQPDTDPDARATRSPCTGSSSSSGSSEHGNEDCSSIQESLLPTASHFIGPHQEPHVPEEPVSTQNCQTFPQIATSSSIEVLECARTATAETQDAAIVLHDQSNRPLHRLKEAWMETDATQLGMRAGGFVRVWLGTETELGWVYVDEVGGEGRAGWMPSHLLEVVQGGYTAVRAVHSCEAHFENQLSVQEGRMFLVEICSRTEEGWAYAETIESPESAKGWVPIMCLEWPEL